MKKKTRQRTLGFVLSVLTAASAAFAGVYPAAAQENNDAVSDTEIYGYEAYENTAGEEQAEPAAEAESLFLEDEVELYAQEGAASEGSFAIFALTANRTLIYPSYVSYEAGDTVNDALAGSGYSFYDLDEGIIYTIQGITDNYCLYYDDGGYDLNAPADAVSAIWFTTNAAQEYDDSYRDLVLAMADTNAAQDGRAAWPAVQNAYNAALSGFYSYTPAQAVSSRANLEQAVNAYLDYLNQGTVALSFDITQNNSAVTPAQVTLTDAYGNTYVSDHENMLNVREAEYSFDIYDGTNNHVRGSVSVQGDTVLSAQLPYEKWISGVDAGTVSGWTQGVQKNRVSDCEYAYYVPDYAGTSLFTYFTPADGIDTTDIRVYQEGGYSPKSWRSYTAAVTNAVAVNSCEDARIVLEARKTDGNYTQYQTFYMDIVRTATLNSLAVKNAQGIDLPLSYSDAAGNVYTGFDRDRHEYAVTTDTDTVVVSPSALVAGTAVTVNGEPAAQTGVSIDLADCQRDGNFYIIEVKTTTGTGTQNLYTIYVTKTDTVSVNVNAPDGTSVEVKNGAGGSVLPVSGNTYQLIPGEAYTCITTKDTYYHTSFAFTAEQNLEVDGVMPDTSDWLKNLAAKSGTGTKATVYQLTQPFSPAVHENCFEAGSSMGTFYLQMQALSSDYTINYKYTDVHYGTLVSGVYPVQTSYKIMSRFIGVSGNTSLMDVTVTSKNTAGGVTYYQDYKIHARRFMELTSLSAAMSDGTGLKLYREDGSSNTGFVKEIKNYSVSLGRNTQSLSVTFRLSSVSPASTSYTYDNGYTVKLSVGDYEESIVFDNDELTADIPVTLEIPLNAYEDQEIINLAVSHECADSTPNTYKIKVIKLPPVSTVFQVTPSNAVVYVEDRAAGLRIMPDENGVFELNETSAYEYTVTAPGYIGVSGILVAAGNQDDGSCLLPIVLEKAPDSSFNDIAIDGDFISLRGNDDNNGITSSASPITDENAVLWWANKPGTGNAYLGCPIIVGGDLFTYAGNTLYRINKETGEVLCTGEMVGASSFSIMPPAYGDGMIFVGLSGGRIQAFNAETLESLWVYTDPLAGQPNSVIVYRDGFIYTGFWNGETIPANFVCISVTDEDPSQTTEAKYSTWRYRDNGFYWAGAVISSNNILITTDDGEAGITGHGSIVSLDITDGHVIDSLSAVGYGDLRSAIVYDSVTDAYYFTGKGGDFYQITVNEDGTFNSQRALHLTNGSTAAGNVPASTSAPVIYNGRAYIGVCGTSQFSAYSGHNITVIDLDSWSIADTVPTQGYPQTSGLLSTAYENDTEYVYIYFVENQSPGKVRVIRDRTGLTEMDHSYSTFETVTSGGVTKTYETAYVLFTPVGAQAQYAINSLITDADGNLYFKNDSNYLMCLSNIIISLEIVEQPLKTQYRIGEIFDGTGLKVIAHYANGSEKDVSAYLSYTDEPLTEDDTQIAISFDPNKMLTGTQSFFTLYRNLNGAAGSAYHIPNVYLDITLEEPQPQPVITEQPQDVSGRVGETGSFSLTAQNAASYQWYYSKDGGAKWYKSSAAGANTDTISLKVTNTNKNNIYRCLITGTDGTQLYSESAGLLPGLTIDVQPVSAEVSVGETAVFTVEASLVAEGGYQWYYSKDGGAKWFKSTAAGADTNSVSLELKTSNITTVYRCRLTGQDGSTLYTNTVGFIVPPVITRQPATCTVPTGGIASYTVEAQNVESYQWYYSKDGGEKWYASSAEGADTATVSFTAKASNRGNIYRCRLTSPTGQSIYSESAGFAEGLEIILQPLSVSADIGDTVSFSVGARNAAAYQWYYSKDGGAKWYKSSASGNQSDTLTITLKSNNVDNVYRCKVSGLDGSVQYTNVAGVHKIFKYR